MMCIQDTVCGAVHRSPSCKYYQNKHNNRQQSRPHFTFYVIYFFFIFLFFFIWMKCKVVPEPATAANIISLCSLLSQRTN